MDLEQAATETQEAATGKMGLHQDIVAPFIGLVTVCTIAWVVVLMVLGKD